MTKPIQSIEDLNNLTDADLRDIYEEMEFGLKPEVVPKGPRGAESVCPTCSKSGDIVEDTLYAILVCKNCGQVIGNIVSQNPEWRQFEDDNRHSDSGRCRIPTNKLLPQSSLGTSIAGNYKSRIKTLHTWSQMPYKERSLNLVFKIIQSKCQLGRIVKCMEDDAKIMYKSISECKHVKGKNKGKAIIIRGKNRHSLIAACLFFACRRNGKTRSPKEIADLFELKYTEITKGCKNFLRLMKLRKLGINVGTSQPEHFVTRFCNELKIKQQYIDQAVQISKNIRKLNIASVHTPFSTATGSILLMAEINELRSISKRKLSTTFKVSEVTITKTFKKIEQYKKVLTNNEMTDHLVGVLEKLREKNVMPASVQDRCNRFGVIAEPEHNIKPIVPVVKCDDIDLGDLTDIGEIADINDMNNFDDFDDFTELEDITDSDEPKVTREEITLRIKNYLTNLTNEWSIEDNIEEYVTNLDLDVYEQMATTDREYQAFINKNKNLSATLTRS
ncbi:MAG: transcription initiation factor IIB [Hyperionvirus sp.]|uniref:Transcription initiation factor IIB n=1 Tax=Hyperionvirus sp. TaxID=2487770 RepID=A0A3G5AB27_9VIRU|nr:MAG: transcription initiation factor IIB [Hyperionvirus sp.]